MKLMQANIGNADFGCEDYVWKPCKIEVEEGVRDGIASHAPDVVVLQEVVPSAFCDALDEQDETRTCHAAHRADEPEQARRVLGDDFTIACEDHNAYECVGVRVGWGTIAGCDEGALCIGGAEAAPAVDGCDPGFSVSRVAVTPTDGAPFTLVNGHPQSGFEYACRATQMEQLFGGLVDDGQALVAGDMNLDPFEDTDESVRVWIDNVGDDVRFRYHSGEAEHVPPYPTLDVGLETFDAVLDHVVSDFADGTCTTLGQAPGTSRLDGGGGTDHRALLCPLSIPR